MATHIQVGKTMGIAVVFSCPGRHEEVAGYPAAKTTGENLNALLSILASELNRTDLARSNITITNAWPKVEYKAKTNRSEATEKEIRTPNNIERLRCELCNITEFIIFCGEKAKFVAGILILTNNPKYIYLEHLGTRGLLSIKTDINGVEITSAENQILAGQVMSKRRIQNENTKKRLNFVARSIVKQLQSNE